MVFVVGFLALIFITEKKFIIKFYNKDYNLYLKDLTPLLKQEGFARDPHLKGHIELNECLKENTARYNLDFGLGGFSYNRVIIFLNDFKHKEVKIHNGGGAGSVWDEPRVVFPDTSVHPWLAHPDWFSYTKARYNYIVLLNDFELSDDHFTQTLFDTKFKCNNYTVYVISKEENIERFNNSKLYAKNKMPQFELSSIFEGRGGFKIKNKILELSLNKLQTVKNKTAEGVITYGPYLRLAKGKYKISIEYEINEFGEKTKMPLEVILTKETKSVDRQLFELKFEENGTIILPKKMQSEILPVEINLETNTLNKKEVKEFIFEVNTRRIKGFQVITLLKDSSGSFTLYSIKIEKI
jgi:hypothetical protein